MANGHAALGLFTWRWNCGGTLDYESNCNGRLHSRSTSTCIINTSVIFQNPPGLKFTFRSVTYRLKHRVVEIAILTHKPTLLRSLNDGCCILQLHFV